MLLEYVFIACFYHSSALFNTLFLFSKLELKLKLWPLLLLNLNGS